MMHICRAGVFRVPIIVLRQGEFWDRSLRFGRDDKQTIGTTVWLGAQHGGKAAPW